MINILTRYGHIFFQGALNTLWISAVVVFFGTIFGALIALIKMSKQKVIKAVLNVYVEIIRGTPILLQLYVVYFGLQPLFSRDFPKVIFVLLALIMNSSAYVAEVFRSGIQAVDKGQFEAAKSLGISDKNMMKKIILPQAIKNVLPALGNEFIMMIKETSLAAVFFIPSLMTSESIVSALNYMKFQNLVIVGMIYLLMTVPLTQIVKYYERKLQSHD